MKNLWLLILAAGLLVSWRINNQEKILTIYYPQSIVYVNTRAITLEFENVDTILKFNSWQELDSHVSYLGVREGAIKSKLNEIRENLITFEQIYRDDSIPVYLNAAFWYDPECWYFHKVGILTLVPGHYYDYIFTSYVN